MYLRGRALESLWVPGLVKPFAYRAMSCVTLPKPGRRIADMLGRSPILLRLCLWVGMLVATWPYILLRGVADDTGMPREQAASALERLIGFGNPLSERLQDWFYTGSLQPFDWVMCAMHTSFFLAPEIVTAYVIFSRWDLFPRLVCIRLGVLYSGLVFYFLLPTEPPWMVCHVVRILQVKAGVPLAVDTNAVAAFPSLHVALPAALAMWLWTVRLPRWALLFAFYTALMALAVTYLGEHYFVDVVAGIALAYLVVWLVAKVLPSRRFRLRTGQLGYPSGVARWALLFAFCMALTTCAIVYLGGYHFVDVPAGIALAYLAVWLVAKIPPSRRFRLKTGQLGHSRGVATSPPDDPPLG